MKILVVTPVHEPAWKYGGVVNSNATLCRALAELGVSVTVYTTSASKSDMPLAVPLGEPVNLGGVTVYYFKSTFGPNNTFYSRGLIRKLWQTVSDFDVVYVVALWQWIGIEAARACRRMKVPMIAALKGGFSSRLRGRSYLKKQLFRILFLRRALRGAAAIHLSGQDEKEAAGGWIEDWPLLFSANAVDSRAYSWDIEDRPAPALMCIPDAVDPNRYRSHRGEDCSFRQKHGIPERAPVLICVARPDWKKRVDLLIGALAKMNEWYLVFVGENSCGKAPEWKRYAESIGVSRRVIWAGFLVNHHLLDAFSASDLFALVSENENFGMVVVEAMLCGLPVMVSKDVGVWEHIKNEPFTILADKSVDSIVAGMLAFRERILDCGISANYIRQAAIDRFSPRVVAETFLKGLQCVISKQAQSCRR